MAAIEARFRIWLWDHHIVYAHTLSRLAFVPFSQLDIFGNPNVTVKTYFIYECGKCLDTLSLASRLAWAGQNSCL